MATRDPRDRGQTTNPNADKPAAERGTKLGQQGKASWDDPRPDRQMQSMNGVNAQRPSSPGKQTEGGSGSQSAPQKNLPTGVTPMSQPKPMGAVPYIGSPSLGQLLGTIGPALVPGGGFINNAPDVARGKFSTQTTGGVLGEGIDSLTGQKPGPQTGWSADPSMTPGRDRAQRGTTSRESFDQTTLGSATGTAPQDEAGRSAARDAENFSNIQMADRRKPGLKQMLETMI